MQPPFLIYLVDDDEDDLLFIHMAFRELGLDNVCKGFLSGKDLLQHLNYTELKERPSVIILDYEMPRMSGLELLQTLRGMKELEEVPIIFYSDKITHELEARLKSLGAQYCIKKGVTAGEQLIFAKEVAEMMKK